MQEQVRAKLKAKIAEFRSWSADRDFALCRLVQYCGVELIGTVSLTLAEVEAQIKGLISEGFYVDWADHEGRLYLRVWEFGGPEPEWPKVFAEVSLADVDELLRQHGFEP